MLGTRGYDVITFPIIVLLWTQYFSTRYGHHFIISLIMTRSISFISLMVVSLSHSAIIFTRDITPLPFFSEENKYPEDVFNLCAFSDEIKPGSEPPFLSIHFLWLNGSFVLHKSTLPPCLQSTPHWTPMGAQKIPIPRDSNSHSTRLCSESAE
jgi:hypothetical protein